MSSRRPDARARRLGACAAAALLAVALIAGCAAEPVEPTASTPASPTPTVSETPVKIALHPDGTAEDNLPLFARVAAKVWKSGSKAKGRAYVDALAKAGFDKSDMQVTKDTTTIGEPAESIQFSVLWGKECLIGQVGPATGKPVTTVMPALQGKTCLVGKTREIDW
ncbi:MAG: hypothetical protein QM611_05725 [Microbacterium sp.]|uniref:DUF6993 domain-containing protein n=1 Tax=Microbacterium sp. TaxID=51671 RepID=UPI0039E30FC9